MEEVEDEKIDYQRINDVSNILSQTDESNYNKLFETLNDIGFINRQVEKMESSKEELKNK